MHTLVAPRTTLIGAGAVTQTPDLLARLGLCKPLIITDKVMVATGLLARLTAPLDAAEIAYTIFADTIPEPEDHVIDAGLAALRAGDFDCLLAFGGGSPIDTAKAIAILAAGGSHIRDWKMPRPADRAALPVIAVPTTAGTGSEVTRATVITDTTAGEKMLIMGLGAVPLAAVVDYELTYSVPPRTTADTGIDSFTHALEAFVSRRANPYSDAMALSAMALIGPTLRNVYRQPLDAAAREAMMIGAHHAGLAFTNASVALVHGMSRPIGAHFHVPHGLSNAMLLPAITAYSLQAALPRYAHAACAAGLAAAGDDDDTAGQALLTGLEALNRDLDVPSPAAWGIGQAAWEARIPRMAEQAIASGSPGNNPRVPDAAEIAALYRLVYAGPNRG